MRVRLVFAVLVILFVLSSCSSDKKAAIEENEEAVAARVGDWTFTNDELQEILDNLSDSDKATYDTPGGRAELADEVIQQELY